MEEREADRELVLALKAYAGTDLASIARKAGIAPSTLQRPANGTATTRLSLSTIEKLRKAYPHFPGWSALLPSARDIADEAEAAPDELVAVPELDLACGMGAAYADLPVTAQIHHFPRAWLRRYTRSSPDRLYFAQGIGDSMEPTLHDGDLLLIDTAQNRLTAAERIWAIAYADCLMIKRLRPVPEARIEVWSDNRHIAPFTAVQDEIRIIGRIIAVQRKL